MSTFRLRLQDATSRKEIAQVASFVGEDSTGSFGILAGHARMMTVLITGLARFRVAGQPWCYLALPGAVLYFSDDVLTLNTREYLMDSDYARVAHLLEKKLLAEEAQLRNMRESLQRMEREILKRLWESGRRG